MTRFLMTAILAFGMCAGIYAEEITEEKFEQLHQSLQPKPNELWRTIPWKISLIDAQQTAADEDKPIFIWAMDGHPLGCT